jgi:hypothetical protein
MLRGQCYFPTPLVGITQQTVITVVMPLTSVCCKCKCKCLKTFPQNSSVVPAAIYWLGGGGKGGYLMLLQPLALLFRRNGGLAGLK